MKKEKLKKIRKKKFVIHNMSYLIYLESVDEEKMKEK